MRASLAPRPDASRALPGPLRTLLRRPAVERVVATVLRSSVVRERGRFLARELARRRGLSRYRLRESGLPVFVRHGTADVVTLDEVFYTQHNALPPRVEQLLRGLGRPPRVLDLGANIGLFGVFVLARFPDALITAVEPDPANAAVLRRCADANPGPEWRVVEAAASNRAGSVPFVGGRFSLSRLPEEGESPTGSVRAVDVLPELSEADLAKIDIEGGEWALLGDERLAQGPPALVLEYHPHLCPAENPHEEAERLLRGAGYEAHPIFRRDDGHGMVWVWRGEGADREP